MTPKQEQALKHMRDALALLDADGGAVAAAKKLQYAIDVLTQEPVLKPGATVGPDFLDFLDRGELPPAGS